MNTTKSLRVLALAAATIAIALVQPQGSADAQSGSDEKELSRIEQQLTDAMLKGDVSAVERHYSDAFTFTTPDGQVMTKAQVAANVRTGAAKFQSSKVEDMKVQVYGDAAVVTLRTTDEGQVNGVDISGQYRWTDVFVRRGGSWQLVAAHGTRVAQQRP